MFNFYIKKVVCSSGRYNCSKSFSFLEIGRFVFKWDKFVSVFMNIAKLQKKIQPGMLRK